MRMYAPLVCCGSSERVKATKRDKMDFDVALGGQIKTNLELRLHVTENRFPDSKGAHMHLLKGSTGRQHYSHRNFAMASEPIGTDGRH